MKKLLLKIIFWITNLLVRISFWYGLDISNIPVVPSIYSEEITASLPTKASTTPRWVIYDYCSSVLNNSIAWLTILSENSYYSAKDSVFLYLICHNISSDFDSIFQSNSNNKFTWWDNWYFLKSSFKDLWIINYSNNNDIDYCDMTSTLGSSLKYCDLTYHIPRVFDMIVNDLFSLQHARIYGLTDPSFEKTIETQIDEYALDKFAINFCNPNEWKYPKLCKTMKNYVMWSAKLLKWLDILNYNNLTKTETNCKNSYKKDDKDSYQQYDYNILYCGLLQSWFELKRNYINLIYNEFLYYALFVRYYNHAIQQNNGLAPLEYQKNAQSASSYLLNQAYEFNRAVNASQKAISLSMKMLNELNFTFPLHVGFMMYQEDLLNLRDKSLYKIVTPLYTLYWKLRNVQTDK
jgi:hypothetical protein